MRATLGRKTIFETLRKGCQSKDMKTVNRPAIYSTRAGVPKPGRRGREYIPKYSTTCLILGPV
jgi:hypothetical protein